VSAVVIAHRAANDPATLAAAAAAYADVVEADVHLLRGRLEVRHAKTIGPLPILWERWYLLPRGTPRLLLEDLLPQVPEGVELMLDLKGPDPRLPGVVLRAAGDWLASGRRLIVCGRVWRSVNRLRGHPGISVLHSAGSLRQLRALTRHDSGTVEGVSADHRLLTADLVAVLLRRAAYVWCWPVNDAATAAKLAGWGVTGFIPDAPHALQDIRDHARSHTSRRREAGNGPARCA
jgi:glycerophosphoryl diester phosphodiesterase